MLNILILLALNLSTLGEFTPSDELNLAYFNILKEAYNDDNPTLIYNYLTQTSKDQLPLDIFNTEILKIKQRAGKITYWSNLSSKLQAPLIGVGFENNLASGYMYWTYIGNEIQSFTIVDYSHPTVIDFLKTHENSVALSLIADGNVIIDYNGSRKQNLMSVFKFTVAMEFVNQINQQLIDQDEFVNLEEINKYHITQFDINHQTWIDTWTAQGWIVEGKVKLIDVARGMIVYSSNACTEFLQDLLTLAKIQETVDSIKLEQTQAYYLASFSLSFLNFDNLERQEFINYIKQLTIEQIFEKSNEIHEELKSGSEKAAQILQRAGELLDGEIVGISAQYFTLSTSNQYAKYLDLLNKGEHFDQQFYEIFYPLIGYVSLSNPRLKQTYAHVGVKGGSSAIVDDINCVFSIAQFDELYIPYPYKTISFALFTQNLNFQDYQILLNIQNFFTALLSMNGHYINAVSEALKSES